MYGIEIVKLFKRNDNALDIQLNLPERLADSDNNYQYRAIEVRKVIDVWQKKTI